MDPCRFVYWYDKTFTVCLSILLLRHRSRESRYSVENTFRKSYYKCSVVVDFRKTLFV